MHPKFDPKVFQLGYVALETADLPRSRDHYQQTIGMTETAKGDDGSIFLSVGYNHHDIVLRPANQKALVHLGFQLKPHIALADFERDVRELGLPAMVKSDSQPGIAELVEVTAPGGNVFQFYSAAEAPAPGFSQRRGGAAAPGPCRGDLARRRQASKVLSGVPWLLADRRHRWDRAFSDVQSRTPCRQHHVHSGITPSITSLFSLRTIPTCLRLKLAAGGRRQAGVGSLAAYCWHNLAGYHYDPDKLLIELYTEMDTFIPELGMCEARPWHEHFPMKPKSWGLDELSAWGADFAFNLAAG